MIGPIKFLNKLDELQGAVLVEVYSKFAPLLLNPSSGSSVFPNLKIGLVFRKTGGQIDEGLERKVIQQEVGLSIFEPLTLIPKPGTRTGNQLHGQAPPCRL